MKCCNGVCYHNKTYIESTTQLNIIILSAMLKLEVFHKSWPDVLCHAIFLDKKFACGKN